MPCPYRKTGYTVIDSHQGLSPCSFADFLVTPDLIVATAELYLFEQL